MKIVCTGGAGFIGSAIVNRLVKDGHDVVVIDDFRTGNQSAVNEKASLVVGDYGNDLVIDKAFVGDKVDVVIQLAASMSPSDSLAKPREYFNNNLTMGIKLLDAMVDYGVKRIVFASSGCVYGIPSINPVSEVNVQSHVTPYGDTKLMYEGILDWYSSAYGISYVALRYFNVSGAVGDVGPNKPFNNGVIPIMLNTILDKKQFDIYGGDYDTPDGTCIRDYVHVSDIVDAHMLALYKGSGAYNLGSGKGYSVKELVSMARVLTEEKISVRMAPKRPGDPAELVADICKALNELGWVPKRSSIETIISDTWEWVKRYKETS